MNGFYLIFSLITIIIFLICVLANRKFNYWKNKNVPYVTPVPFLGNYGSYILLQEYIGHLVQKLCQKFPDAPYFGAFFGTEPVLVVQSPEILKHILTKDFYYFHGREITKYQTKEAITQNMFLAGGDRWKIVRQNMSPLFSSAKMKNMFYLIENCCHVFEDSLDREISMSDIIEAREFSARFTMDCISSCGFGIESNTMLKPENNPFKMIADEIFDSSNYRGFKIVFRAVWPAIFYGIGMKCFPDAIGVFFSQLLKGVFHSRGNQSSTRNDFVDLILNLKKMDVITSDTMQSMKTGLDEKINLKVDDDFLVSQCVLFFAAGFETSASTMSFTLFELAKNQEVQKRAADEVDEYLRRHNNTLNYECVNELPYLEACIYETLRKYPVVGNLTREVMDDYTLPDGLILEKGVRIHVPVYQMHHDPNYFPEPELYKPERFLPENRKDLKQYIFLPFGEGPRVCLGKRFAKMQVLAGLTSFLKKYRVELAEGMAETVILECRTFLIQPRNQGLMLKVSQRDGWEQRTFLRA